MIYIYNGTKFKVSKWQTSDDLIMGITNQYKDQKKCDDGDTWDGFSIDEIEKFNKRIERGLDIFCFVDFYEPGYSNMENICWFDNMSKAEEVYYKMIDEV